LHDPAAAPQEQLILLGASNLTMAFRPILRLLHELRGVPLEIYAALGHGRSYGLRSNVSGRVLPGITTCGLWEEWGNSPPLPARALLTDIGNDLFYNASVNEILDWIRLALRRLRPRCAQIALTLVPLENARAINPSFYRAFLRVCFANCRVTQGEMLERATALNAGLIELAAEYQVTLVEQPRAWYGWDPIHHRRGRRRVAWETILDSWRSLEQKNSSFQKNIFASGNELHWWTWWRHGWPARQEWQGRVLERAQPCLVWPGGTRLSLY
jgi:hypothetical protein